MIDLEMPKATECSCAKGHSPHGMMHMQDMDQHEMMHDMMHTMQHGMQNGMQQHSMLAQAYVPMQHMDVSDLYPPEECLKKGTVSPQLYMPYEGGKHCGS